MTTAHNPLQSSGRDEAHLPCGEAVPRSTESPEVAVGAAEPLLLCAPAGLALGDVPTRQPIGIVLTVLGVVVLDFSADATEGPIRAYLLDVQRRFAREYNVILDGRDIGTVVLPDADLKIYLTASSTARAQRRLKELQGKGVDTTFEEVLKDIELRDYQDTTREIAPLRQAEDAVLVDTSDLDFDQSFEALCAIIEEKLPVRREAEA